MPNFEQSLADLPSVDKEGNAVTESNPLTLEDVLVRIIESTDPVLGLVAGVMLEEHRDSPYNWALLGLVLRDIFLDNEIDLLAALIAILQTQVDAISFPTIPDATTTVKGKAELTNEAEGRGGTDNERILTSLRALDALREGSAFEATESRKGVSKKANQAEGRGGTDDSAFLTSLRILDALRNGSDFAASTDNKGVGEFATNAESLAGSNTTLVITPRTLKYFADNYNFP